MLKRVIQFSLALALMSSTALSGNYVNWGKSYKLTYPDDWRQIERFNVENFFKLHGKENVDFDAFFCPVNAEPFYSQAYVISQAEETKVSQWMIDSVMSGLRNEFESIMSETGKMGGPIKESESQRPTYDAKTRTITQVSHINSGGQEQVLTLFVKFYDVGICYLYCYTAVENYSVYKDTFKRIADSFTDQGLDSIEDTSSMKVREIEQSDDAAASSDASGGDTHDGSASIGRKSLFFGGPLFIIVLIIILARKKRRKGR